MLKWKDLFIIPMVNWSTVLRVFEVTYKLCPALRYIYRPKWADEEQEQGTKGTEKLLETKIIPCEH